MAAAAEERWASALKVEAARAARRRALISREFVCPDMIRSNDGNRGGGGCGSKTAPPRRRCLRVAEIGEEAKMKPKICVRTFLQCVRESAAVYYSEDD